MESLSIHDVASNVSNAQKAGPRGWRGERIKSGPERAFLIGPGTEGLRQELPFLKEGFEWVRYASACHQRLSVGMRSFVRS
jgi:hypothetical protein